MMMEDELLMLITTTEMKSEIISRYQSDLKVIKYVRARACALRCVRVRARVCGDYIRIGQCN